MILLITAMPSQNIQYILISCGIWSLFADYPVMMYPFSFAVSVNFVHLPVVFVGLTCILGC